MAKKQSNKRIIGFLLGLWRIAPVLITLMIVSQVVFSVLNATIAPIFVSQLLTHIADGSATLDGSIGLLIGYSAIIFIGGVIAPRVTIAAAYVAESRMQSEVSLKILRHLTDKSLGYHSNQMSGGVVSNANKLVGAIERFWDTVVFNLTPIFATLF